MKQAENSASRRPAAYFCPTVLTKFRTLRRAASCRAMHGRDARCTDRLHALLERPGTPLASPLGSMFQRCAYYVSLSSGALRMELTELEPQGPYRLIGDDADSRHIEYFA